MFDKLKQLSKETAIYGISTIVGRFLNFLLVPFYTHVFSNSEFGIYSNIYAYVAFLNIFYLYGMEAAFLKFASLSEKREKRIIFSVGFWTLCITSALFSVIFLSLSEPINRLLLVPADNQNILLYIIGILFLDTLSAVPFASLRLEQKALKFAIIKILNIVVNLSLNLLLILKYQLGIEAVFVSNLFASALSFLLLLPEIIAKLSFTFPVVKLRRMLKFGLPYLPASLSAMMVQVIDKPILTEIAGPAQTGIYQANYKLGIFMMLFVSMFQYAWQPFFLNNAKAENAKEIFSRVLTIFALTASIIVVFLSLFIENAASVSLWNGKSLIGESFLGGVLIVPVILFSYYFHGLYVNFTAGIYIEEKTEYFPVVTLTGAVVNVVSNLILIPVYGYWGAAIATLLSYVTMSSFLFYFSQKFYKVNYELKKIFAITFIIVAVLSFFYLLHFFGMANVTNKIILFSVFIFFVFIFRIVSLGEIKRILYFK